jgi:hypothetical protein
MSNTKIIVVTLVKDEAWMLERFLSTCSKFADHIIVSDESTGFDNSLEIYPKFPKVILHHNPGNSLRGESARGVIRRRFVFQEARKIVCDKRIIIAIDSDEIISANIFESPEWKTVLNSGPGTLFHLQWVTLWKNYKQYRADYPYLYGGYTRQIWVDDGVSEIPVIGYQAMHQAYNPLQARKHIYLNDIVCLHYQACNWRRMESKHRFYRAYEKSYIGKLSDMAIYRIYGHILSQKIECRYSPSKWFDGWEKMGIDMTSTEDMELTHWDLSLISMLQQLGTDVFALQDIWRVDWNKLVSQAKKESKIPQDLVLNIPKLRFFCRLYHIYMRLTIDIKFIRFIERKLFKKGFLYES